MITVTTEAQTAQTKTRKVTIHKPEVYSDIDAATFKFADANPTGAVRQENAIASDTSEKLDRKVVASLVEYRDALLRKKLQSRLAVSSEVESADDILDDTEQYFFYMFDMPQEYNDTQLRPLAIFIHRYLVYGALYDWYLQMGSVQASYYRGQLDEVESAVLSNLRSPSATKRPLQPFGPAGISKTPLNF